MKIEISFNFESLQALIKGMQVFALCRVVLVSIDFGIQRIFIFLNNSIEGEWGEIGYQFHCI
ncbi:hypothetical protein CN380_02105 [Bacillus sp. AFS017274]|nr:hypothetical protein CN380_02105 [Bacillus sp. AFS017274]